MRIIQLWNDFWNTEIVFGTAINSIPTPALGPFGFMCVLYIMISACFIISLIYFKQLAKALVFSFAIANLIFAFRMDYTWLSVFASDLKLLSGKSAAEKTVILDGMDLYDFIEFVKMTIPPGEKIRDMEDEVEWHKISFNRPDRSQKDYLKFQMLKLSRFYLLPRLVSSKGRFALVYNDPDVFYDRDNNILGMKDISFRARPYGIYGKDALIFEIMEDL